MSFPLAATAGGTFILIAIVAAIILAVAFGFYTYRGSGINAHPNDGLDGAPDAAEPSQTLERGRPADPDDPFGSGGSLSGRGTK